MKYIYNWGKISLLEITGPDGKDFLHRLTTANFKQPLKGSVFGAF